MPIDLGNVIDKKYIKERLYRYGYKKVALEDQDNCVIIYIWSREDDIYLLTINYDSDISTLYAKIVHGLYVDMFRCENIEYAPLGLYVFAKDLDELIDGIVKKIDRIARIKKKISGGS